MRTILVARWCEASGATVSVLARWEEVCYGTAGVRVSALPLRPTATNVALGTLAHAPIPGRVMTYVQIREDPSSVTEGFAKTPQSIVTVPSMRRRTTASYGTGPSPVSLRRRASNRPLTAASVQDAWARWVSSSRPLAERSSVALRRAAKMNKKAGKASRIVRRVLRIAGARKRRPSNIDCMWHAIPISGAKTLLTKGFDGGSTRQMKNTLERG